MCSHVTSAQKEEKRREENGREVDGENREEAADRLCDVKKLRMMSCRRRKNK